MKKNLFILAAAAVALASCSSDDLISENAAAKGGQPQEIALNAFTQKATRAAVLDGTFPTASAIQVAAYDAQNNVNFFNAAEFTHNTHNSSGWWGCSTAKYWPLSPATINFLGYANLTAGSATWSSPDNAAGVTLAMADNSTTQNDLMYAVGQGKVTQTGNALNIPEKVDMVFKHAQALLTFNVKANVASTITLKKITLNNAIFAGSLALTSDCKTATAAEPTVTAATWTPGAATATFDAFSGEYAVGTNSEKKADIMVVPHPTAASFDSFTLTYRIAGVDKDLTYTFTPVDRNLAKATKYVYDITFNLHEIFINASVTPWIDTTPTNYVEIPMTAYAYSEGATAGTFNVAKEAGTYTVYISDFAAASTAYDVTVIGEGVTSFLTVSSASVTTDANKGAAITFTVTENTASDARTNASIKVKKQDAETYTTIAVNQAGTGN